MSKYLSQLPAPRLEREAVGERLLGADGTDPAAGSHLAARGPLGTLPTMHRFVVEEESETKPRGRVAVDDAESMRLIAAVDDLDAEAASAPPTAPAPGVPQRPCGGPRSCASASSA